MSGLSITYNPEAVAVPEPSSLVLLSMGGISMALAAWRRRRAAV